MTGQGVEHQRRCSYVKGYDTGVEGVFVPGKPQSKIRVGNYADRCRQGGSPGFQQQGGGEDDCGGHIGLDLGGHGQREAPGYDDQQGRHAHLPQGGQVPGDLRYQQVGHPGATEEARKSYVHL